MDGSPRGDPLIIAKGQFERAMGSPQHFPNRSIQSKQSIKTLNSCVPFDINNVKKLQIRHNTQVRERGSDKKIFDSKLIQLLEQANEPVQALLPADERELAAAESMRLVIDEDKIKRLQQREADRRKLALLDPFKRNMLLNQDSVNEMSGSEMNNNLDENLRKVDSIFGARTDSIQLASAEIGINLETSKISARNKSAHPKRKNARPSLKLDGDITISTIGEPGRHNISVHNSN